ncbi:MAG: type III pantothenate kinase [Ruthenibacterium sp.]
MILAIDVGNTNIVFGCIDENSTYFVARTVTDREKTSDEFAIVLKNIIEMYGVPLAKIEGSIISSVVPPLNSALRGAVEIVLGRTPLLVGPGIKTGLNILIDNPAQLGSDLVVDAVAAIHAYEKPLIIIDMGTATTFSVVDQKSNYLGGAICSGLKVSLDALTARTSQLQSIGLEPAKAVIGRNTIDCMKSGAIYGSAAMLDGMIDRIEEEMGEKTTVVVTGGLGKFVVPYCKHKIIYDDALLLKGLWLIYQKNIEKINL